MKLFTIGDSISQGFMSLAAAHTDLSYSTLIAKKLGLEIQKDYRFADWNEGIPIDVEAIMRRLNKRYGSNIGGLEWLTVAQTINDVIDLSEDYYERGNGNPDAKYGDGAIDFFHNVAVWGFELADAWQITPRFCKQEIQLSKGGLFSDGYLTGPDNPMYRTALKILNPGLDPQYNNFSQLSWLEKHAGSGDGVENTVLWLGANNALGTVTNLKINQTPNNPNQRPGSVSPIERLKVRNWNLWHPDDFKADYGELLDRVDTIMKTNKAPNWRVFVATIPLVTIAPLAKGVGETTKIDNKGIYYKYYTYFPFEEDFAVKTGIHLTMQDALYIDDCIRAYNESIKELIDDLNAKYDKKRYHVVDICQAFEAMAYKRNDGQPTYDFPDYFDFTYPKVNTKYYHADTEGRLKQGGLITLDGVHPSAIGQGLLAYEFLKVMSAANVTDTLGAVVADGFTNDEWQIIFNNDTLYSQPITIMQEIYGKQELAEFIVKFIKLFKPL